MGPRDKGPRASRCYAVAVTMRRCKGGGFEVRWRCPAHGGLWCETFPTEKAARAAMSMVKLCR